MDTGTVVTGLGVLIALFGYLEIIRRDLRAEIRDVRQASETAHKEIQTRLSSVETQLAALTAKVDCVMTRLTASNAGRRTSNKQQSNETLLP